MADAATNRVTVDGLEMDLDDNGEIVRVWSEPAPSCEPTYALSHRFGWPDANGVMRCACGAWFPDSITPACLIYAPVMRGSYRVTPASVAAVGLWPEDFGIGGFRVGDPVEAERQRCERLGVEWVGPNVQDAPPWTPEEGYALGISSAEIEEAWNEYVGRHGLTVKWDERMVQMNIGWLGDRNG